MGTILDWLPRALTAALFVVALGFGAQSALGSAEARTDAMLCEGTCPDEDLCARCCIQHGGTGGECWNPPTFDTCICIG